ncbi:ABC transporter permease [Mycoplasmopsis sturni]|uniref:ABC transporter permease n=1 Tax=Mycoplasmopsis sturni TaxID=39047 RepID=UPI00056A6334|nr:ABC transporter permease [Mycoplasmopsis sturni]
MKKQIFWYSQSFTKLLFKKKTTILFPIFFLFVGLLMMALTFVLKNKLSYILVVSISAAIMLLTNLIYGGLKALNIFKDTQDDGLEILILSKPISRLSILTAKNIAFIFVGISYSLFNSISFIIGQVYFSQSINLANLFAWAICVNFVTYLFFGYLISLISIKLSPKLSITIPLISFIGILGGGMGISSTSTTNLNNAAYYLETKNEYQNSGKLADLENFYLKNNKDAFYIIPNGFNKNFSEKQISYLDKVVSISNNSAKEMQWYTYLAFPYQFFSVFVDPNAKLFNSNNKNYLDNTLFYNHQDSVENSYKLKLASDLVQVPFNEKGKVIKKYIIPGALKNKTIYKNQENSNIIYAREKASKFNVSFPEDEYVFASPNNLVGEIKWDYIQEIIQLPWFQKVVENFYNEKLADKDLIKDEILELISQEINRVNNPLYTDFEGLSTLTDKNSFSSGKIKSLTEQKVYFAVAYLYYIYFAHNNSTTLRALLYNVNTFDYQPSSFKVKIGDFNYFIGGFGSYSLIQKVEDQKVIMRYELTKSNNTLFQSLDTVYEYSKDKKIIIKSTFIAIWITMLILVMVLNTAILVRKDYK